MPKLVIALSGLARSGKDTFCRLVIKNLSERNIKAERFALADTLKERMHPFLVENFNINVFDCTAEQKELIRPLMVEFGKIKRKQSEGKYWTRLLQQKIESSDCSVAIVTDVRYDEYPQDEVFWAKDEMKSTLVNIVRLGIKPPNKEELENEPRLRRQSDYVLSWLGCPHGYLLDDFLNPDILKFITWLETTGRLATI